MRYTIFYIPNESCLALLGIICPLILEYFYNKEETFWWLNLILIDESCAVMEDYIS